MTNRHPAAARRPDGPPGQPRLATAARHAGQAVTLFPAGALALCSALTGHREAARRRWLRAGPLPLGAPSPGAARLVFHGALTILLGVVALLLAGALTLAIARGLLYGFVDRTPHDSDWGGPTLAGAWLVHFAVSVPCVALALVILDGLTRLNRHTTAPLRGERRPAWALPTAVLACVLGLLFVIAFVHQLP
ncbi:NUDIX hydrolase [Streptomyces sp. NPDC048637]|uniref:NUDIX hydrolase n=1 Tax=Streptomyces sp. NPDC048637 TaxID=3155636 RepID=UPI003443D1F7